MYLGYISVETCMRNTGKPLSNDDARLVSLVFFSNLMEDGGLWIAPGLFHSRHCRFRFVAVPRVDDRRVISSIIYVLKHGLQWKDAPSGVLTTLYNRFRRWAGLGVFDRVFSCLASNDGPPDTMMIDAAHLKAHRTASSLVKGGIFPSHWPDHRDVSDSRTGF
ncbi:transposase [Labrenzia suaedae]|uniref:Transposase n=1 Tax=Roseibium litorale TaxID=2803841 RepID=A0ABR9CRB5_9HYPH|nr:transposase [Roseibium litorale]MBD8893374.1 transposase [Roseibium litorale]